MATLNDVAFDTETQAIQDAQSAELAQQEGSAFAATAVTPAVGDEAIQAADDAQAAQLAAQEGSAFGPNPVFVSQPNQTQRYQQTFDNPLFEYESYTYNLSWHILSVQDFKSLTSNPTSKFIPMNCLVASGGKNSVTFARNIHFLEDFYIEDLKILTMVNTTNYNKNSNAIEIDFTIIETNGFTLLNRLQDAVASVGGVNYLRQPYLLMIEFTGHKNGLPISTPNQTKYIPISLVDMKTNLSSRGTEYRITAVPFNHSAFNETVIKTPAMIKIQAKDVQSLLGSTNSADPYTVAAINAAIKEREEAIALTNDPEFNNFATEQALERTRGIAARSSIEYAGQGLCDGINAYLVSLTQNTQAVRFPNTYRVVFDKEIGESSLVVPNATAGPNNIDNSATRSSAANNAKAAAGIAVGAIDFNGGVYTIKPGTSILSVIDYAVRNSTYVTQQLIDPLASNRNISEFRLKFGESLKWYRIIPSVQLGNYDPLTRKYQMFVTYYVKPWTVSVKNPYAPLGRAAGYVKKYDYMFTGQNRDVIDLKIDFDMLFYVQLTSDPNKIRATETGPAASVSQQNVNSSIQIPVSATQPYAVNYVSSDQSTSVRTGPDQVRAVRAADTTRDLTLNSRGDMINIQLRIIGDPHFIKQDDLFLNQNLNPSNSMFVSNNNQSLVFDSGELYVYLNIQSPTDYSDATGLAIPGLGKYQYSAFNGVYKIITINNEFRQGKFEQVLDLIRIPIEDKDRNTAINIQSRSDRLVSQGLGQLTRLPSARFVGPLVLVNQITSSGIVNPAAISGAGGIGGLVQGLVGQIVGQVTNQLVNKAVNTAVKGISDVFSGATREIKDALGIPRGLTAADENVFDPTYGGTLSGLGSGSVGAGAESVFDPSFGGELGGVDLSIGEGIDLSAVTDFSDWDLGGLDFGSFDVSDITEIGF